MILVLLWVYRWENNLSWLPFYFDPELYLKTIINHCLGILQHSTVHQTAACSATCSLKNSFLHPARSTCVLPEDFHSHCKVWIDICTASFSPAEIMSIYLSLYCGLFSIGYICLIFHKYIMLELLSTIPSFENFLYSFLGERVLLMFFRARAQ